MIFTLVTWQNTLNQNWHFERSVMEVLLSAFLSVCDAGKRTTANVILCKKSGQMWHKYFFGFEKKRTRLFAFVCSNRSTYFFDFKIKQTSCILYFKFLCINNVRQYYFVKSTKCDKNIFLVLRKNEPAYLLKP